MLIMAKKTIKKEPLERGRPTDYKPEYCQKLEEYFSAKPYELKNGRNEAGDTPTLAGFAASIRIHRATMIDWCKKHPDFLDAYNLAKELQENWLVVNGNKGLINPAFGMFTLKNVSNWRDKRDVEISGNVTSMSDEELDKKLKAKLESQK